MIKKGKQRTIEQPRLRRWARGEGRLERDEQGDKNGKETRLKRTCGIKKGEG